MFRTYEPAQDRLVAVKAFRLDLTPEQARALADELQRIADASLDHPSIVRPLGAGIEGTIAYMASEYVAAESLDIALRHYAPASLDTVLPFITQLAGAIDFARTAGVGHGALHPRDILVTPDEARATGFGIVQALEKVGARAPVRRPYSAPERVDGGEWDVRADVYSLGAIAFELLTGRRPVGGEIGELGPTGGPYAAAVAAVLSRALASDPASRFPRALEFAAALEAATREERVPGAIAAAGAAGEAPMPAGEPELRYEPDVEEERDADLAEIQLREEEIERPEQPPAPATTWAEEPEETPAPREPAPVLSDDRLSHGDRSLFDLDLDRGTEDVIPEVQHPGFPPEPGRRFDSSEFTENLTAEPAERAEREPIEPLEPRKSVEPIEPIEPVESRGSIAARPRQHRPRPVLLPVALTLLLGLFVGFLAGYLVGSRDREPGAPPATGTATEAAPERPAEQPPAAAPARPSPEPRPSTPPRAAAATSAPAPAPVRGRLVVRSTPPGAQVFVNGRRRGTTPLSVRDLAPGTYTLRVTRAGFREDSRRVTVAGSGAREVNVRLTRERTRPAPAPAAAGFTGVLYVDSRPRGARVVLDGRAIGTTPLQVGDIRAGAHVVRLELANHRPWTTSTRVVAGETTRVTGSLERQ